MNKLLGGLLVFAACLTASGSGASGLLGDQARAAGKPLIADFGMNRCLQCIEQAKTMEELRASLDGRVLLQGKLPSVGIVKNLLQEASGRG